MGTWHVLQLLLREVGCIAEQGQEQAVGVERRRIAMDIGATTLAPGDEEEREL